MVVTYPIAANFKKPEALPIGTEIPDFAFKIAQSIQESAACTTAEILRIAAWLQQMKQTLKRNEFAAFLQEVGWAYTRARKYLNVAKVFDGFEESALLQIEPTTLFSLCAAKYSEAIAQLRKAANITQEFVEELMRTCKPPKKQPQTPINGWKAAKDGTRYYNLILHDEKTGIAIEAIAQEEGILPQRLVQEAIALWVETKRQATEIPTTARTIKEDWVVETTATEEDTPAPNKNEVERQEEPLPVESSADILAVPTDSPLKQLRKLESIVGIIQEQIEGCNSSLAKGNLDRKTEMNLGDTLKQRQNLRLTKIAQICDFAEKNGVLIDYELLHTNGRVVIRKNQPFDANAALEECKKNKQIFDFSQSEGIYKIRNSKLNPRLKPWA